jgi:N-acetylglucosamine-6-phosphate deacetylase
MLMLSGGDLVLPDRILTGGGLIIDEGRIAEIRPGSLPGSPSSLHHHYIVPGFVDVHVHGVGGTDALDDGEAIEAMARLLPRFGVTAFCPTTIACAPAPLRRVLDQVRRLRETPLETGARVLPAHLESNFLSEPYRGAQPIACLRKPASIRQESALEFTADAILREIERAQPDIGIITMAPELQGGLDLVRKLTKQGHRVSLGHSAATYEEAIAAIEAGARHAAHLFNCMPPLHHRRPGLAGAILQREDVAAELIADGIHLHRAVVQMAIAAKKPSRVMAVTDGTAASAAPENAILTLGGQRITRKESAAYLEDGTLAGSAATMDRIFRVLVGDVGLSLIDAVMLCSTTPAREMAMDGHGAIAEGAVADLVVLDRDLYVLQTYVGGRLAYDVGKPN